MIMQADAGWPLLAKKNLETVGWVPGNTFQPIRVVEMRWARLLDDGGNDRQFNPTVMTHFRAAKKWKGYKNVGRYPGMEPPKASSIRGKVRLTGGSTNKLTVDRGVHHKLASEVWTEGGREGVKNMNEITVTTTGIFLGCRTVGPAGWPLATETNVPAHPLGPATHGPASEPRSAESQPGAGERIMERAPCLSGRRAVRIFVRSNGPSQPKAIFCSSEWPRLGPNLEIDSVQQEILPIFGSLSPSSGFWVSQGAVCSEHRVTCLLADWVPGDDAMLLGPSSRGLASREGVSRGLVGAQNKDRGI
ncbi:hypothetical protein BO78DRAFT_233909 [Aspergillus sclerotiicarbonarius CBS 121057]|uniref:Uncharacterized protein n=1 Tax=Aspergillus sclerotiicarbonarius (strain CBS 121057 / IBT 28362) TaxID=1448318 RepID=A0A319EIN0_ASPSB|nr:hypothetical protein BO78DRAFT_233909 [Aspergillus sclerotiicarbonarius CBS 121057]